MNAVDLRDALEPGRGDDSVVGHVVFELLLRRTDEKLVDEHILACEFVDDAETLRVFRIRAREAVEYEYVAVLEVREHLRLDGLEFLAADRNVDLAPRDLVVYRGNVDYEFVVGRASGIFAGLYDEGSGIGESSLASFKSELDEFRYGKVAVNEAFSGYPEIDRF